MKSFFTSYCCKKTPSANIAAIGYGAYSKYLTETRLSSRIFPGMEKLKLKIKEFRKEKWQAPSKILQATRSRSNVDGQDRPRVDRHGQCQAAKFFPRGQCGVMNRGRRPRVKPVRDFLPEKLR